MSDKRSKSLTVFESGPQGSCLTPSLFLICHNDMWSCFQNFLPNLFPDDLACVVVSIIGVKHSRQFLGLEEKFYKLSDHLEYYRV